MPASPEQIRQAILALFRRAPRREVQISGGRLRVVKSSQTPGSEVSHSQDFFDPLTSGQAIVTPWSSVIASNVGLKKAPALDAGASPNPSTQRSGLPDSPTIDVRVLLRPVPHAGYDQGDQGPRPNDGECGEHGDTPIAKA